MDIYLFLKVTILGIVEGLTEFLPISSTGHLIFVGHLLDFNDEKWKSFEIVIQSAAILAVCWEYKSKLKNIFFNIFINRSSRDFLLKVLVAFLPAVFLGLMFGEHIKRYLFSPEIVATTFILGAIVIILVEKYKKSIPSDSLKNDIDNLTITDAFKIGCLQCFALIPGTSRSGASIIGAMIVGYSRKVSTEFSFYLAIPTIFGASVYSLYLDKNLISIYDLPSFGVGAVASFFSAFFCIRWLIRYVSNNSFFIFAWYRIAFGILILISGWFELNIWE
tara:strand:+ start:725 stop:1555 length:831 start_codon:yes stop_codon:yes gene_type:complete